MKKILKNRILRIAAFLLLLSLALEGFSRLSYEMGRDCDPMRNYSTMSFFEEPKNSIDVLTIGTSSVYSSVSPLNWWEKYGYTGYTWGEPSQRIFETYEYLKKIYRVQNPSVVFIEVGNLYRDDTQAQVMDSVIKARLAKVFPVIAYHRNIKTERIANLKAPRHSVTKGYLLRAKTMQTDSDADYMKKDEFNPTIHYLCKKELKRCIDLCQKNGSKVVLLSIPDRTVWNDKRCMAVEKLAQKWQVPYLELNTALEGTISWKTDTTDGGTHLNYRGAEKVTDYMGKYLAENYQLTDHREDPSYHVWQKDWDAFSAALAKLRNKNKN